MHRLHVYQLNQAAQQDYFKPDLPEFIYIDADDDLFSYPVMTQLTYYDKYHVKANLLSYQALCHIDEATNHPEYFI